MDDQPGLGGNAAQTPPTGDQVGGAGDEYKPNIYQLIFWALTYGVIAGAVLFVLRLLANYLALVWGPVFLAALAWGGYRNYLKQKLEWHSARGEQAPRLSPMDQIREAARDIVTASQEVAGQQQEEDRVLAERAAQEEAAQQAAEVEVKSTTDENPTVPPPSTSTPPQPPTPL